MIGEFIVDMGYTAVLVPPAGVSIDAYLGELEG